MSILDDDIMSIDQATGRFAVILRRPNQMSYIISTPGGRDNSVDAVRKSMVSELESVPIMDFNDEFIRRICLRHIKSVYHHKKWELYGPGDPRQISDKPNHWEFLYKNTAYTPLAGFLIFVV